ncbi:hypothetical protein CERSUDRAFT_99759 [Gelatoporia subvermispora B]|uniref:Uncharacterized protein n=1 Tax=Ceriporiopsis subvermispora (strain B) TaxID=914234 RepID=M2R1D7_CERS8|nr:hypothetical protein CERSUDRAFT_99759 [Gelatoporia subvermispora B]
MPATRRTSRRAESRQPLQSRPVAKADIIILSSDDESSAPKKPLAPKKNINERTKKAKRTPIPISAEILEISSEDEGQNPMSSQTLGLEQLLKEANQEIERLKQKLQQCATSQQPVLQLPAAPATARDPKDREITRLQEALTHSQHAERKTKATIASLDEHVSCEICTCKIWVPYT